ncbi:MAG TPA: tetratricopeptide repeat protein [Cyclobacteriaceae bacterium]|jgi:signal transduction histidine kinase|nr:tetratricopeptide repeat protein [Cyclobacteriaceae bacterium]
MKCGAFLFVLSVITHSIFGQSRLIDSLTQQLSKVEGKEKVDLLNRLTFEYISKDNDKAKQYSDQALSLSSELGYERGAGVAYTYKGVFEYLSGEFSDGRTSLREGLRLATKTKDVQNQGYTLIQLGNTYLNQALIDSSLTFFNKAHQILKDSTDPLTLSKLYKNLAALYGVKSDYEQQKKYLLRCIKIRELLNDNDLIANALIALITVYLREDNFEQSGVLFERVEKIIKSRPGDLRNLNDWRHQKALYLLKENKFEEATVLFDSASAYYFKNSLQSFVTLQTDLGRIYYERGEYEIAMKSLYEASRVAELKSYIVEIIDIQLQLGWVNFQLGELKQSLVFADRALSLAQKNSLTKRIADALTLRGVTLTGMKDFTNAKTILDQVLAIRESLKDNSKISEVLMNIGFVEIERKNYAAGITLFNKSLALAEQSKYDFAKAWCLLGLSIANLRSHNYTEAAKFIDLAENFAKGSSTNEILIHVYEEHRDLLAAKNNYKDAYHYSMLAYKLKDSLHRSDLSRRFVNLQKIDEIERRDRDIKVLTKDKELAENKINLQQYKLNQQYFFIAATSIGIGLLAALAIVYARYYFRVRRLSVMIKGKNISIQRQADKLKEINQKLVEQNKLIETQKEQLLVSNENLESEVDHRTAELSRQNLQLEQFAFMTSHNLRAPVARLLGLTQLFNAKDLGDPLNQQLIEMIKTTSKDFDATMRDLSSILEIKRGVNGNFAQVKFEDCLLKARITLNEFAQIKYSLTTQFDEPSIYGIEPYLISVFYNLLSNSAKFKKETGVLEIHISSKKENNQVILEYKDNGIGFNQNEAGENLFKPYKRFHIHREGKGLGLYMIKLQIESMGGTVMIQSEEDKGFLCLMTFDAYDQKSGDISLEMKRAAVVN